MALFPSNPLSLSVPDPTFESWLRSSGYLEIIDTHNHHHTFTPPPPSQPTTTTTTSTTTSTTTPNTPLLLILSHLTTLFSLLTLNPFAKLTTEDFSSPNMSWTTGGFIGGFESYGFPGSPGQVKLRVCENVKRYARNYLTLVVVFFVCSLYKMPIAVMGLVLSLGMWDLFKLGSERWGLDEYPRLQICLVRIVQCGTAVLLYWSNVQVAVFSAIAVSYAVVILHASLRKLSPIKQPTRADGYRRSSAR